MIFTFIITSVISIFLDVIKFVLVPLDLMITNALPNVDTALTAVNNYFGVIVNSLGYVVSLTMLSSTALSIIVMYFSFALVFPLTVHAFKFIYKWWATIH